MKKLKALDVKSVFKVSVVLGAVAGVLVGLIVMIADIIAGRAMEGVITLIAAPFLYGIVGALVNAFMAKIYNLVADRFGGIEMDLE